MVSPRPNEWRKFFLAKRRLRLDFVCLANAPAQMNAVSVSDSLRKFVETPMRIGSPHQAIQPAGRWTQSLDLFVASSEEAV